MLRQISKKWRLFYAMPFTGKSYSTIVRARSKIRTEVEAAGLELLEQFVGRETREKFEAHKYGPLFIAEKDHDLLRAADIVIADYSGDSIGRDCEIVIAKEEFDKRVISVVPDAGLRNHPWIRLYSDYVVASRSEALQLAQELSGFDLSSEISKLTRQQKDRLDVQLKRLLKDEGLDAVERLLPSELVRRWKELFKSEYRAVLQKSFETLPRTMRVNKLKISRRDFVTLMQKNYGWHAELLGFSDQALQYSADETEGYEKLPEYRNGMFYVQQLSSQLPVLALEAKPGQKILEIGAAPGSKTTQLGELLKNRVKIVANDNSPVRVKILRAALRRQGVKNVSIEARNGSELGYRYPETFDRVMVDSFCSSDGIFRYKAHRFLQWYLLEVYRLYKQQRLLIDSGYRALKPGGILVYSTCTFSPEENEAVVDWLLKRYPGARVEPIRIKGVKLRPGFTKWTYQEYDGSLTKTVRTYPQDNNSTGFFIAKIRKPRRKAR